MSTTLLAKQPFNGLKTAFVNLTGTRSTYGTAATSITNTTASGTLIHCTLTAGGSRFRAISAPLATGITISGNITVSVRARETNASANAGISTTISMIDPSSAETVIGTASFGAPTELTTTDAAKSITVTPSSTFVPAGNRLILDFDVINVGTMGGAQTVRVTYGGNSSGASGDTFVTFTEAISFETEGEYLQGSEHGGAAVGFDNTCTVGSTLLAMFTMTGTSDTITSVSDDAGQSYTLVLGPITGNARDYVYKKENNGSATAVTITATTGSGTVFNTVICEVGGVAAAAEDTHATNHATSTNNPNAGTLTTGTAYDILVALFNYTSGTPAAGTNFVFPGAASPNVTIGNIEYGNVRATGSYVGSLTLTGTPSWEGISIALKGITQPAAAASGTNAAELLRRRRKSVAA